VNKAEQCWDIYAIQHGYLNAKLALIFIIIPSSPQPCGTGMEYCGKRVPDDAKSLHQYTPWEGCLINVFVHFKGLHGPLLMTS